MQWNLKVGAQAEAYAEVEVWVVAEEKAVAESESEADMKAGADNRGKDEQNKEGGANCAADQRWIITNLQSQVAPSLFSLLTDLATT